MNPELVQAVLRRGGHRCAWCACKLDADRVASKGTVCQLDLLDGDSSFVASCVACAAEFVKWWPYTRAFTIENAKRILGRHNATESGPFVDYLNAVAGFNPNMLKRDQKGLLTPFTTALARIEAQRNAPLDLVRKVRAA